MDSNQFDYERDSSETGVVVVPVTSVEELSALGQTAMTVVVDFYKDNCAPCSMQSKVFNGLTLQDPASVMIVKIKLEDFGPEYFAECGVRSLPSLKIFAPDENEQAVQPKKDAAIFKTGLVAGRDLAAAIESLYK